MTIVELGCAGVAAHDLQILAYGRVTPHRYPTQVAPRSGDTTANDREECNSIGMYIVILMSVRIHDRCWCYDSEGL